ncbi:GNAT family N-acetyltransferase [Plantactinospora sp. KLBMP9567]|uniref:GNAT family N-acetyltransferase n=1 Tax=Plantactinospora sp. KLBMP9567 TaxID=3085900 RepID=UPI0029817D42|nr:GNAT family N-acetyltransferase [Plantactinospora sp. KLBMP9567]MDW5330314.1 GNAT family N-acetyltransferase [Plantactinospora sp. KLBMP9567]
MSFDRQPVLTGNLVRLRPLTADDLSGLQLVASDPLIWTQHPDRQRHTRRAFRRFFDDALGSGGALIAENPSDGAIMGTSRFHGYDPEASEIEIGWTFLARKYWGGAVNGEIKQLMLCHAFRRVGSVIFLVASENARSRRAVEKIGAVPDGRRLDGSGRDCVLYRVTAAAWKAAHQDTCSRIRA